MLPPFDLQGGLLLAASRDASVTCQLSAFGAIVFRAVVAPRVFARIPQALEDALKRRLRALAQISIGGALLATGLWLIAQAATMADAGSIPEALQAVPTVLLKTSFGHVLAGQLAAFLVLGLVLGWRDHPIRQRIAPGIAVVALSLQAGHSHAASMYEAPSLLLGCDIVHLLGAGAWLGGLLPLLLVVRAAPPEAGAIAARRFSPLGQWCIAALAASAMFQGWVLVSSIPGLVGTAYGWMVLVKLVLFGVLLGFAWVNRYRFAPALLAGHPHRATRVLIRSIALQTGVALVIVIAAVVLSELPPAMHLQALWPFPKKISLEAVTEDPDFLREAALAGAALAGALLLLVVVFRLRRFRIAGAAAAAVIAWFSVPHLDVLLATAYPTSFYHSPTGFSAESIVDGQALFARNCVACHGAGGRGDGPAAHALPVPPADLTAAHLWMHSDGELFWWLSHGMRTPEGTPAMPGFAAVLDEDQRWHLIDYIRAHNAGVAFRYTASWPNPVHAPGLSASCGGKPVQLADLHGRFVRLVIGSLPAMPPAGSAPITILAGGGRDVPANVCLADDETVPAAYAVISEIPLAALAGTQFLIDDSGWIRAVQRAGGGAGWNDPQALKAEIMNLRDHPVATSKDSGDQMKMPM